MLSIETALQEGNVLTILITLILQHLSEGTKYIVQLITKDTTNTAQIRCILVSHCYVVAK